MEDFKKYSKIYRVGHPETMMFFNNIADECVIQEKVDGGNFRIFVVDGKIIIGSRTQQLTSDEGEDTNMNKNFERCSNYVRRIIKDKDLSSLNGCIIYGENMIKHTLSYDWETIPPFLGFDVYDTITGIYNDYDECVKIFSDLGLPMVPLVKRCKIGDIKEVTEELVPVSVYAPKDKPNQKAEGVVFKNYTKQQFVKFVRDDFKEANSAAFGGSPKLNKEKGSDNSEVIFKFCTNARIDKCVYKLLDSGNKLEMQLMKYLPNRVYDDIMEEEWKTIVYSKWKVDFKTLKKTVTKRCLSVLNQIITNNRLT